MSSTPARLAIPPVEVVPVPLDPADESDESVLNLLANSGMPLGLRPANEGLWARLPRITVANTMRYFYKKRCII